MRRFLEIFQKEKDQEDSFGPIDWIDIDQALRLNQDSNDRRPIFIVVHRKNCQKSKGKTRKFCNRIKLIQLTLFLQSLRKS